LALLLLDAGINVVCERLIMWRYGRRLLTRFLFVASQKSGGLNVVFGKIRAGGQVVAVERDGAFKFSANPACQRPGSKRIRVFRFASSGTPQPDVVIAVVRLQRDGLFRHEQRIVPELKLEIEAAEQDVSFSIVRIALQRAFQHAPRLVRFAGSEQFLGVSINTEAHIGQEKEQKDDRAERPQRSTTFTSIPLRKDAPLSAPSAIVAPSERPCVISTWVRLERPVWTSCACNF